MRSCLLRPLERVLNWQLFIIKIKCHCLVTGGKSGSALMRLFHGHIELRLTATRVWLFVWPKWEKNPAREEEVISESQEKEWNRRCCHLLNTSLPNRAAFQNFQKIARSQCDLRLTPQVDYFRQRIQSGDHGHA